jgi:Protein of unknown function (DUF2806)
MSDNSTPIPWSNLLNSLVTGTTAVPQSVAKLIDTVGEQMGFFLEPIHIRRRGQAKVDVAAAEAEAKAELAVARAENKLTLWDIEDRTEERVLRREAKRQKHLESIVGHAARALSDESSPGTCDSISDQPVDEDWVAEFFNLCQDIGDEQMQLLWARLLAREVTKPGSLSLRTLAVVRTMGKRDAELFTRFCSMLWMSGNSLTPITLFEENAMNVHGSKISFTEFIHLDSFGLIRFDNFAGFTLQFPAGGLIGLHYFGKFHVISKASPTTQGETINFPIGKSLLSDLGQELVPIARPAPNELYRQLVVSKLRQTGWEVAEH